MSQNHALNMKICPLFPISLFLKNVLIWVNILAGSEGIVDEEEEGRDDGGNVEILNLINRHVYRTYSTVAQVFLMHQITGVSTIKII